MLIFIGGEDRGEGWVLAMRLIEVCFEAGSRKGDPSPQPSPRRERELKLTRIFRHDVMYGAGQRHRLIERTQPHVAAKHHAVGAGLHVELDLAQHRRVVVVLLAAGEQHHRAAGRTHHACAAGASVFLQLVVGPRHIGHVVVRLVQLDDVGTQLQRDAGSVILRVQRIRAALGVDGAAARIGPHDQRHAVALAILAHLLELAELVVLARRTHIHGVADRVGTEAHGILDRSKQRRGGLVVAGDIGLAVELEDQWHPAAVLAHVLLGQANAQRDGRKPPCRGELKLVARIDGRWVGKEIGGTMLQSLVKRQHQQAAVARPVAVQQPPQAGALAVGQGEPGKLAASVRNPLQVLFHFEYSRFGGYILSYSIEFSKMPKLSKQTKVSATLDALCAAPLAAQQAHGYADTLREILQQPATWLGTADLLCQLEVREQLRAALVPRPGHIVLTGSGSSMYIGECLAPSLQLGLGIPTQAIAAGSLLTHWRSVLPPGAGLLISLARSGDSPESSGVVDRLLADAPDYHHLVITCNANGKPAT